MSYTKLERTVPVFENTEVLDDFPLESIRLVEVPHMAKLFQDSGAIENIRTNVGIAGELYNEYQDDKNCVIADLLRTSTSNPQLTAYVRAGARKHLWYNKDEVGAVIVTCGGICPGLNNIIREIVVALYRLYGVTRVYGMMNGYGGFTTALENEDENVVVLTPEVVDSIHHQGGTFLRSARGGFNADNILTWCQKHRVNQIYVVGGDGTHRGANALFGEIQKRNLPISIGGIPKTIDNDIAMVDRSFGFETAVQECVRAIDSAMVEAMSCEYGVGIVKLMGRDAGFIAAYATLASHDVDCCLIPEVDVDLYDDEYGVFPYVRRCLEKQRHCVLVTSEGITIPGLEGDGTTDASGNKRYPDVGLYLKKALVEYFASEENNPGHMNVSVKYIDPSYMIRSVPASAFDSIQCLLLAENVVHGMMAGFTGFTVGVCNNRSVYIPIKDLTDNSPRRLYPFGRTYERVVNITGQPDFSIPMKKRLAK
ncbi:hypothetical protein WA556_005429, partial [Blastocystis sp. ATCC 50177/Nand II]